MLPTLSSLRQYCQHKISLWPCYQPLPGLFLGFSVRTPLASYGAIGQKKRWMPNCQWHLSELNGLTRIPNLFETYKLFYLKLFKRRCTKSYEGIPADDGGCKQACKLLDLHFLNRAEIEDNSLDNLLKSEEATTLNEEEPLIRNINNQVQDLILFMYNDAICIIQISRQKCIGDA